MIDLHCHILPGIDDGAKNLEASIRMAESAVENGITHILCTPHHNNGRFTNPKGQVMIAVEELQAELDKRNIDLTLFEGQEVRLTADLILDLENDDILFVDVTNRYLLVEFPSSGIPLFAEQLFFELLSKDIIPVIVHPERNAGFLEDPNLLIPFIEMGALTQLTAPSYVGKFGKKIQKMASQMIKHNLVHMVATDAHNVERRGFCLKEAYEKMEKEFGKAKVEEFKQIAKDLVNGDDVKVPNYKEVKIKKFLLF